MKNIRFLNNAATVSSVFLTLAFLLGTTEHAFAQAASLGDVVCNAFDNTKPFAKIFQYVAYASGAMMTVGGIYNLRGHTESPQNHPLHRGLLLLGGSGLLLTLPSVISMIIATLYSTPSGNGQLVCNQGASSGGGTGLDGMMSGFIGNIASPMISFVSVIAIASGIYMIVRGLHKAGRYGYDPKSNSMHIILTHLGFGALLLTIGANLNMMMGSIFGSATTPTISTTSAASSVLSWGFVSALGGGSAQFAAAVGAALTFVQVIGAIAFVRGWMVMKKVVEGGGNVTMAQGITHIVGGTLAINIFGFLHIMDTTFGTNLL